MDCVATCSEALSSNPPLSLSFSGLAPLFSPDYRYARLLLSLSPSGENDVLKDLLESAWPHGCSSARAGNASHKSKGKPAADIKHVPESTRPQCLDPFPDPFRFKALSCLTRVQAAQFKKVRRAARRAGHNIVPYSTESLRSCCPVCRMFGPSRQTTDYCCSTCNHCGTCCTSLRRCRPPKEQDFSRGERDMRYEWNSGDDLYD